MAGEASKSGHRQKPKNAPAYFCIARKRTLEIYVPHGLLVPRSNHCLLVEQYIWPQSAASTQRVEPSAFAAGVKSQYDRGGVVIESAVARRGADSS